MRSQRRISVIRDLPTILRDRRRRSFKVASGGGSGIVAAGGGAGSVSSTQITLSETSSTPAAPAPNQVVIFARDNGGKTELCARFPTGAVQSIAIEP